SKGYDGWTTKQKEANAKANALREELARLEKGNKTVEKLVSQKGDDAGTWAEYQRELKKREIESKGKVTPYDIYEYSKLDAIVDLERSTGRNIDKYKDAKLIEAQLTKNLGVNVSVDKNNNITFKGSDNQSSKTWQYVGMDINEATQYLQRAGTVRNISASNKINESYEAKAVQKATANRKLNLNAVEA
ncbi:hypothetical protein, partial [Stenotrophomonas maltophilia group sp. RNC7]|uniref:hypothetical protein n=1 Tax=Stenotrophomonas maltophilia group sp. RNC7 TaxID=3071467 RepID=UPI0027E1149B